jgi:uncharacterized protein YndB with AHSA1/START domain
VRVEAQRELLASRDDVWALLSEPQHLSDWWPGYATVRPDRRGLAEGARWQIVRTTYPGLLRRPGGEGLLVITAVDPGRAFSWRDLQQGFRADLRLESAGAGRSLAEVIVHAAWWRLGLEGLRPAPRQALARLHALCQTTADL